MAATKISWTAMVNKDGTVTPGKVWNPVTGCTEVSAGCAHCYARRMAKRLQAMGQAHYKNGFTVTCHDDALDIPLHWRKPARIFVNSMSDLFHKDVPVEFIARVFDVMKRCPQHTFMILTKRPELIAGYKLQNIWLGVSVENQKAADDRIPLLLRVDAAIRFLSCEPLLGQLDISPYLDYNTHKGEKQHETSERASVVQSGQARNLDHRQFGEDLGRAPGETEKCRTQTAKWLSSGQKNDRGLSSLHGFTPDGVDALQRENSCGSDDQSQEWDQGRQQTGEPGTGDILRAATTCFAHPKTRESRSTRDEKCNAQIDRRTGDRDTEDAPVGYEALGDSGQVRGSIPNGIKNSEKRTAIGFVIVGGESGPHCRPMELDWARSLRDQCREASVPFFFKQAGGLHHGSDLLDGVEYKEFPK